MLPCSLLPSLTYIEQTNNLNAVLPYAAWEIELDHNGKVINNGNPPACGSEWGSNDSEYSADTLDVSDALGKKLAVSEGLRQVAAPEEKAEGHVGWKPCTPLFFFSVVAFSHNLISDTALWEHVFAPSSFLDLLPCLSLRG